ncbi:NB-ARC domain-containing protein [Leptothoe sp. LEGE 181152]|nr:NB-ARC domain-containing protein [Leptothoe sp. LEGE 181152]
MARYALVIGISEYKSKHLANLSKPVQDAEAIANLLQKYGQCNTEPKVLKGEVTTKQLAEALQTFLTEQAVNSEAIIYFTGHGISIKELFGASQGYLATSDCDVSVGSDRQPTGQQHAISFANLNSLIQCANLSSLVMLIDACHSGNFIEQTTVEESFSAFSSKQNRLLITACRDFESAFAKKSDDHSLFTGAILDALVPEKADPTDGVITGASLTDSLSRALKGSRQELVWCGKGRLIQIVQFPKELLPESIASEDGKPAKQRRVSIVPMQRPPLPDHFVERPEHQKAVKDKLLCEKTKLGTLVVSAIYGLGGIGKSVLASKLAHDDEVQAHFCDGILWATLGQNPDILPLLSGWIQALGDHDYKPTAIEAASNHLRTLLYSKQVLLVVDDVWHPEHLDPFRVGEDGCCVLVTTREARISGADRYDLDVMTADQALELMTQKLSDTLSVSDRERALEFATRVGFLPLALELAASQIEEGVTWQQLFEDFQTEVVRLETLDIYGQDEIPDDAKRRKYSLLACFNLSLKQLSGEQLRQFAWLGVIPEDVNLTQEMAETLWQLTSRQSGSILRIFRAKALVLQGVKQANGQPSYRMHDLMHDLAGRLLMSSPQPIREGELPGLGLTKAEAHSELLNRYRAKTSHGQWYTLEDDGYIYAHLTWHMEQAKQPQAIHRLLQASNEQGCNGWYEACDAIGKPAGFVNDLGRAWQLAIKHYDQVPSESVALVFRYALIRTSLNSLASNVPAELVSALVEKGVWQAAQGLAYAQQAQNPWHRAECIAAIVPHMPKALLPEVIKTIDQINDAVYRSYVLSKLAETFTEVWPNVLASIQHIQDRYGDHRQITQGFSYRAFALEHIAPLLPRQYLPEAIEITRQIQDAADRSSALIKLAQQTVELWPEALEVTRQIQDESSRSRALSALAEHLPESLWPEALAVTRQIQDEDSRSSALSALAEHLPESLWPEALDITRDIKDNYYCANALQRFLPYLEQLSISFTQWTDVLDTLAYQNRSQLINTLPKSRSMIVSFGHEQAFSETLQAVRDVCQQWP